MSCGTGTAASRSAVCASRSDSAFWASNASSSSCSVSSGRITCWSANSAATCSNGRVSFGGAPGAAATRAIQLRCMPVACLISPPIDKALTDGAERACPSVRPCDTAK
ncbi:hypothetical protein PICSAR26_04572 [Mycobacterium avium subsp. paratuberculosis]|nr:hypothetical protein PICSAR26_04572 [Mycobacterium avium subsp. paratuberculosis]